MTSHYLVICHLVVLIVTDGTDSIDNTIKFAENCHLYKIRVLYMVLHHTNLFELRYLCSDEQSHMASLHLQNHSKTRGPYVTVLVGQLFGLKRAICRGQSLIPSPRGF